MTRENEKRLLIGESLTIPPLCVDTPDPVAVYFEMPDSTQRPVYCRARDAKARALMAMLRNQLGWEARYAMFEQCKVLTEPSLHPDLDGKEFWYRYEYWGSLMVLEFEVIKHTPKGVWLDTSAVTKNPKKFVLNSGEKRYAYPTPELAWRSFRFRKRAQVSILRQQLANADAALNCAESHDEPPELPRFYIPTTCKE